MSAAIHPFQQADWSGVQTIYQEGLDTGIAAFMSDAPDWASWDADHLETGRLVARVDGALVGWAALLPVPDT